MSNVQELIASAQTQLSTGETVVAAGIFGLQDDYKLIMAGGLAASIAMPTDNPLAAGVGGAAAAHVAREMNAAQQGVSVRMLIAVSEEHIYVFSLTATGSVPQQQLMVFDRQTTQVHISKFGLSRRIMLITDDGQQHLGLTGTIAPFSSFAAADKSVLVELVS